jgi:hypothetical protein
MGAGPASPYSPLPIPYSLLPSSPFTPHPRRAPHPKLTTSPLTISRTRITSRWRATRGGGGAGRPGSRPMAMTNIRCWARRTPCSAASAPLPGAWNAIHQPGRSRRSTSPHPDPVTGARMVCPPTGRGIGLRPPAPALRRGPAGEPASLLRGTRIMPRAARPSHPPPTNIMNHNLISPDAKAVTPLYRVHGRREAGSRWVPI